MLVLRKRMDALQFKMDKYHKEHYESKKERILYKNMRKKWRRELGRLSHKVKDLKRDMHWKVARDIVQEYVYLICLLSSVELDMRHFRRKIHKKSLKIVDFQTFQKR